MSIPQDPSITPQRKQYNEEKLTFKQKISPTPLSAALSRIEHYYFRYMDNSAVTISAFKHLEVQFDSVKTMVLLAQKYQSANHLLLIGFYKAFFDKILETTSDGWLERALEINGEIKLEHEKQNPSYNNIASKCEGYEYGLPILIRKFLEQLVWFKVLNSGDKLDDLIEQKLVSGVYKKYSDSGVVYFIYDDNNTSLNLDKNPERVCTEFTINWPTIILKQLSKEDFDTLMQEDGWELGLFDGAYCCYSSGGIKVLLKIVREALKEADKLLEENKDAQLVYSVYSNGNKGFNFAQLNAYLGKTEVSVGEIYDLIKETIDIDNKQALITETVTVIDKSTASDLSNKQEIKIYTTGYRETRHTTPLYIGGYQQLTQHLKTGIRKENIIVTTPDKIKSILVKLRLLGQVDNVTLVPLSRPIILVPNNNERTNKYEEVTVYTEADDIPFWSLKYTAKNIVLDNSFTFGNTHLILDWILSAIGSSLKAKIQREKEEQQTEETQHGYMTLIHKGAKINLSAIEP